MIEYLIVSEKHLQYFGSITSQSNNSGASSVDTDTIAGETTTNSGGSGESSTNIDVVGLAVFKGDVLIGELTSIDALCHLIVVSDMEECILTIPSPFDEDAVIDLYVTLGEKTKNDVQIINGSPFISTKVNLDAKILSSDKNSNFFEEDNLALVEEYANSYVKSHIEDYLYKTSKAFGSDIDLFGRHAVKYFATWDKWIEYNWLDHYRDAFFNVETDVNVISSYLIS